MHVSDISEAKCLRKVFVTSLTCHYSVLVLCGDVAVRAVSAPLTFLAFTLNIELCVSMAVYQMLLYTVGTPCASLFSIFKFFAEPIPPINSRHSIPKTF